jgi:hypothetical protein
MNELRFILKLKEKDWVKNNFDSIPLFGNEMHGNFIDNQLECEHKYFDDLTKYLSEKFQLKLGEHYTVKDKIIGEFPEQSIDF